MVEYRPVPDADVPEFQRLLRYAFSPTDEYDPIESLDDLPRGRRSVIAAGSTRTASSGVLGFITGSAFGFVARFVKYPACRRCRRRHSTAAGGSSTGCSPSRWSSTAIGGTDSVRSGRSAIRSTTDTVGGPARDA